MTDEELSISDATLIARLRELGDHASFEPHMHHTTADRIEKLVELNKELALQLLASQGQAAERAEAALAAQIEVDAGICAGIDNQCGMEMGLASSCADTIRSQPHDRTALDRHDAKTREKALREAADELRGQGYGAAVRTILALIEKPQCV